MSTENGKLSTSSNIRASVDLSSSSGKHGPLSKARRQDHRRRQSGSRDNFTVYSLDEGELVNKHHAHKPVVRTSGSDLCLQERQPRHSNNSTILGSGSYARGSGYGYNYNDSRYTKAIEFSQRARKSHDEFRLKGPTRPSLEACEEYVNKLMKESEIRECEEQWNYFRRNGIQSHQFTTDSACLETSCLGSNHSLHLSETRVRARSRNTCSASEYSSKSMEGKGTKFEAQFDNYGHEKYENVSLHHETLDPIKRSKTTTENNPINLDTKNRGDSDVPFAGSKDDYARYNESDAESHSKCLDFSLKNQHSRQSRKSMNVEKQRSAVGQESFSFEKHATGDVLKEAQAGKLHEDSRVLRKVSECDHNYGETMGTNKNFSYSHNLGDVENVASNPALAKQRLWEQTIIEESTISADTSKCLYASAEEEVTDQLTLARSRLEAIHKKRPLLSNNEKRNMQMPLGAKNKACNDWLLADWKKNFRQCSANLQRSDVFSNDENSKDEKTRHGLWRPNAYGTGSSLDTATTSSEDEAVGESLWTCTKWTDENSEDTLHQSKESQWAYEVYSNTSQQPVGQAGKNAIYKTSNQFCSLTAGSDHPKKHMSVKRGENSDACKISDLIGSSVSECDRCPWGSKLDLLFDDKNMVGKLPDFTDIMKDCLQLRPEEVAIKSSDASKINNKINVDFMQRICNDNQESLDDSVAKWDTDSFEKEVSSHKAKATSDCGKKSKLESKADVKQTGDKHLQGLCDVRNLMEETQNINHLGYDKCRAVNISPRQTPSGVDEKLMKTVHSIKEDIEGVLQMLSTLDSQGGEKDIAVSLLNEVLPVGKPFTVSNVNCATDFVKQAYNKLISFKNAFLTNSNEQEDSSSYYEYKRARDDYIAAPGAPHAEYDIENIFYNNIRPTSRAARDDLNRVKRGINVREKLKTDKKFGTVKPNSANRKIVKGSLMDKKTIMNVKLMKRGGFKNRSVTEMSQSTSSKNDLTPQRKARLTGQIQSGKKTAHFKSPPSDIGKKYREDSTQKKWGPAVSNINEITDLKLTGAGDRATLAFLSSNRKSRKGSSSPPKNKGDRYAYGNYPFPTFIHSPENISDESKHSMKQIQIRVEKIISKRSSPEEKGSKYSKARTYITDTKRQETDSITPPLKKTEDVNDNVFVTEMKRIRSSQAAAVDSITPPLKKTKYVTENVSETEMNRTISSQAADADSITPPLKKTKHVKENVSETEMIRIRSSQAAAVGSITPPLNKTKDVKENVSETEIKRKRSSQSADGGKTMTNNVVNISQESPKKDKKQSKKLKNRSNGDNQMIDHKSNLKTQEDTQNRGERNRLPSISESSGKVTGNGLTHTLSEMTIPTGQLNNSVSQKGALETEAFISRAMDMVVSGKEETPTQRNRAMVHREQTKSHITPELKIIRPSSSKIIRPSSSRRSKRSSRKTRSRDGSRGSSGSTSRNRKKKRKKSTIYTDKSDNDAKLSSSDNSLSKKSNHKTRRKNEKINHTQHQEPLKPRLRKTTTKSDEESRFPSGKQNSPLGKVSQSDIDVVWSEEESDRGATGTGETGEATESDWKAHSTHAETMAWPLTSSYDSAGFTKNHKNGPLIAAENKETQKDGSPRADMSTSELNVSIKKLYEEINKLRLQLEASAEEAMSRPLPKVEDEEPIKFARSYKVFTQTIPLLTDPMHMHKQIPDFTYRNVSQTLDQPAISRSYDTLSATHSVHAHEENTPSNYARINEVLTFLESRMRKFDNLETKINNSNLFPKMAGVMENCAETRNIGASNDNNPSSCNMKASQSVISAREINNWLNEEVYVTASCDGTDSDTQNDATDKFDTAPSDNDYSSCNLGDVNAKEVSGDAAVGSSVNNNMRSSESTVDAEVITNYHNGFRLKSPNLKPGKSVYFQKGSTKVYEISSENLNTSECHQHISNCLNSSEKKCHHLVKLCSETSRLLKEGSANVARNLEVNSPAKYESRLRGQSTAIWETIATNRPENISQNKGSPRYEPMSGMLPTQLQVAHGTTTDNPASNYEHTDLEQTEKVPLLVQCVKGRFLGSDAATSVKPGSSPQSRVCPKKRQQSPKVSSANIYRKTSKSDSVVSDSDVDEASICDYVQATRGKQNRTRRNHNNTTLDSSPIVNNYLPKKQKILESLKAPRTCLRGINAQNDGSLADKALGWNSQLQGGKHWTPKEVIFSCGKNNKRATLMQRNLPKESQATRLVESYSPTQTHIIETDKIMNHYSDAISAKSSKRFMPRPFSKASVSRVSKNQDLSSAESHVDFSESDRQCLNADSWGNTKETPKKAPNSIKDDSNSLDDGSKSGNNSEFLPDKEAFLLPGGAPNADQNSIIASFESMMQKKRPYYVEHCGFRQNTPDTVLEDYNVDVCEVKSGQVEFHGIKATFQVVTIINDNNSSTKLKPSTVISHSFDNSTEALCEDFSDDTDADKDKDSENIVASAVDLEERAIFWSSENIGRSTDIPANNLCGDHNRYSESDYWDDMKVQEEGAETDYGKALLKPQSSTTLADGENCQLSLVLIEDCREHPIDESSDDKNSLLLDTDEAESWYKTTEEGESEVRSSMKNTDDKTIVEETDDDDDGDDDDDDDDEEDDDYDDDDDDCGNVEAEIVEENEDIDYEQEMSDNDDDDYDNNDNHECDD